MTADVKVVYIHEDTKYPLEAFREEVPTTDEVEFDIEPSELPEDFLS
ncbi:hypothetical protein LCGC14_2222650, partial [marine sediment metagenome]